jgi:hypothetical protein
MIMLLRRSTCAAAVAVAATLMMVGAAQAADAAKYPDWKGGWARWVPPRAVRDPGNGGTGFTAGGQPSFDQTKPWGAGQEAPLTPEYRKVLEDSMADQANGGEGNFFDHAVRCMPGGMPLMTIAFTPLEFVVTPETTYILIGGAEHYRRIFTDGRDWPKDLEATYAGYSIGKWVDTKGDGHYDELDVETRAFKGPRAYDASGLPLHHDNQSVINERFFLDKNDPNIIYDEITVHDHALTQPWTIIKKASRKPDVRPKWHTEACSADNSWVRIGSEAYYLSADGLLMPAKKNQTPPDLRYFKQTQK